MYACPSCARELRIPVCEVCALTLTTTVTPYTGGRGFVTTEQAVPCLGTMKQPVTFSVIGEPLPKGQSTHQDKKLGPWQKKIEDAARVARLAGGETGAFTPIAVALRFTCEAPYRTDLLARAALDGLVHSKIIHDDSNIVDLVATKEEAGGPQGDPGLSVTIFPEPLSHQRLADIIFDVLGTQLHTLSIQGTPRVLGDGKAGALTPKTAQWLATLKDELPRYKGPVSLRADFGLPRWLEPASIDYPIVNGRDIDKLIRAVAQAGGYDLRNFAATKRLADLPGLHLHLCRQSDLA